jgi:hypothetical protein
MTRWTNWGIGVESTKSGRQRRIASAVACEASKRSRSESSGIDTAAGFLYVI